MSCLFMYPYPYNADTTAGGTGSASLQGTVVAIYEIGCLFGSIFTFFMGETLGRRRTIMLGCSILIVGATLQTTAYGIPQMIVGRIVTGLGNGINTSTVPVWHSETTQAHNRGRALAIELAINIFGVVSPQCPSSQESKLKIRCRLIGLTMDYLSLKVKPNSEPHSHFRWHSH
jgi:MFS family permease